MAHLISQKLLDSLLESAKLSSKAKGKQRAIDLSEEEDDVLVLPGEKALQLPFLNPGPSMPKPYFAVKDGMPILSDEYVASTVASAGTIPAPPSGDAALSKKEKKEKERKEKKLGWFELPTPSEADRPALYREIEALRLRNQLDPKRFYRRDEGEGKGIKGMPKQFALGTILVSDKPFGGASEANLPRAERKRSLVEEFVSDSNARDYAKKKFKSLQEVRGARGKGTNAKRLALRRRKW